jgi:putative oxidoreductase
MRTVIGRFTPQAFAIMRFVTGLLFACHGSQKLLNWPPGNMHPPIASLPGLSGVIELVCGLLIAVGFLTGIAAFIASGEMAVAYFMAHFPHGPIPLLNQGELAAVYCFLWLYVGAHGAGIWSIDNAMRKK